MGLELEAWYGSSWEPTESQRFIMDAQREYAARDFPGLWNRLDKAAAAHQQVPPREGGGLVLGRFYPPHLGHAFLLQVAERSIKGPLHVYVVHQPKKDGISANWRQGMLQKKLQRQGSKVLSAVLDRPIQGSPEQPEFWQEWANWLRFQNLSPEIRTLFASDPQAQQLASALNLDFVLVDPERRTFPISATMIRKAPWDHWDFIDPDLHHSFARSVVLLGPEGAGKTTLSKTLAAHYGASRAPEYAEFWASKNPGKIPGLDDFKELADGQSQLLSGARLNTRRFSIADTDLISLALWKQRLHGVEDKAMVRLFAKGELYLVLDDAPWKGPAQRDEPAARTAFVQSCLEAVRARGLTPILISGPRESRAAAAIEAIDAWVRTNPAAWER